MLEWFKSHISKSVIMNRCALDCGVEDKNYKKRSWKRPENRNSEKVGQTYINTCRVSKLKKQNIYIH